MFFLLRLKQFFKKSRFFCLFYQFKFLIGEMIWQHQLDFQQQRACAFLAVMRHSEAFQTKHAVVLGLWFYRHVDIAFHGVDLDFSAKDCSVDIDVDSLYHIIAITFFIIR